MSVPIHRFVWGYGPSGHAVVARSADPPDWEPECLREMRSWNLDPTVDTACVTPVGPRERRLAWLGFRSRLVEPAGERAYVETVAAALPWPAALAGQVSARGWLACLPALGSQGDLPEIACDEAQDAVASSPPCAPAKRACLGILLGQSVALRGADAATIGLLASELLPPRLAPETAVAWGLAPAARPGRPGIFVWPDRLATDGVMVIQVGEDEGKATARAIATGVEAVALSALIDRVAAAPDPRREWRALGAPDDGRLLGAMALGGFVAERAAQGTAALAPARAVEALLRQSGEEASVAGARIVAVARAQAPGSAQVGARVLAWLGPPVGAQLRAAWDALAACCALAVLEAVVEGESLAFPLLSRGGTARTASPDPTGLPAEAMAAYWAQAARLLRRLLEEHPVEARGVLGKPYVPPRREGFFGRLLAGKGAATPETLGRCLARLPATPRSRGAYVLPSALSELLSDDGRERRRQLVARWTESGLAERLGTVLTAIWQSKVEQPAAAELAGLAGALQSAR